MSHANDLDVVHPRSPTSPTFWACAVASAHASTPCRRSTRASGASARSRSRTTTTSIARVDQPREDRGRPREPVALRRPAAGRVRPVGRPRHRLHAAGARRPARRRARPRRGLDQERHAQPHQLVQGPRRLDRAEQGARVRVQGRGLRVHRQPRQLGRRARGARRVCAATCSSRRTSSRARSSPRRSTAATSSRSKATTTTSTGCARSSPASTTGRS